MADVDYRTILADLPTRKFYAEHQLGLAPGTQQYRAAVAHLGEVARGTRSGERGVLAPVIDQARVAAERISERGYGAVVVGGTEFGERPSGGGGGYGGGGDYTGEYPMPDAFHYTGWITYVRDSDHTRENEYRQDSELRLDMLNDEAQERIAELWDELMARVEAGEMDYQDALDEMWEAIFEEYTGYEASRA